MVKMKSLFRTLLLVLAVITLFSCVSCEKKVVEVDIDTLVTDIFAESPFGEELVSRDLDDYSDIYGFKTIPERVEAYVGGGATADELIIIKSASLTSIPTSITLVEIIIGHSPFLNEFKVLTFSSLVNLPCKYVILFG